MTYLLYALAVLLVFDALRMRGRIGALGKLDPPAILDTAQHPSLAVRCRVSASGAADAGR